jgi:hypothetical protein
MAHMIERLPSKCDILSSNPHDRFPGRVILLNPISFTSLQPAEWLLHRKSTLNFYLTELLGEIKKEN